MQIWGQSVLEIHGSCDGISVATSRRFFRTNLSSEREDTPRYNTTPLLRGRVTPWRWMGGSSQLLGWREGHHLPRLLILGRPLAPPCTPVGSSLASRGPHAGGREDNVRWGRRCADNQLKTFRTQEVSFAHNKSNWSPAHKPCQIVLLMVRPDSKTNFQKFLKHFLQWYPIWSYVTASLIRPIQFPILVPNYEGQEYCIKSKIFWF